MFFTGGIMKKDKAISPLEIDPFDGNGIKRSFRRVRLVRTFKNIPDISSLKLAR
jgi:hypothetical protein